MFKQLSFSIFEYGVDLAPKRSLIIQDLIQRNKGEIIPKLSSTSHDIISIVSDKFFPDYILTSKTINSIEDITKLQFKSNDTSLIRSIKCNLYSYEWVTSCMKLKKLIDIEPYKIELDHSFSAYTGKVREKNNLDKLKEYIEVNKEKIILNNLTSYESQFDVKNKQILFEKIQQRVLEHCNNKEEDDDMSTMSQSDSITSSFDNEDIAFSQISTLLMSQNQEYQPLSLHHRSTISSAPKTLPSYDKSKFAFFKSRTSDYLNSHITDELQKIYDYHTNEGNKFEALAYRKAISQIKNFKQKISSSSQIEKMRFIGSKISKKIEEILHTGSCNKGNFVSNDPKNKSIKELCQVWGIGIKQANEFYHKGIKSIDDLKINQDILPSSIKKGLKYYEDIQIKIPREEVTKVLHIIKEELMTILPENIIHSEVCGSYRRGKAQCGDIDVIITRMDDGMIDGILKTLLEKLTKRKFIKDVLNGDSDHSFMGIYQLEGKPYRRIDIKVYYKNSFSFAILYFTGSAYFNRSLRLFAKKIGYHLGDKDLINNKTGESIQCKSEREIFEALGIDYKEPNERDI